MQIYPLTFNPILKERIWGGNNLKTLFGKELQSEHMKQKNILLERIRNLEISNNKQN